jgi:hypothetical protein
LPWAAIAGTGAVAAMAVALLAWALRAVVG